MIRPVSRWIATDNLRKSKDQIRAIATHSEKSMAFGVVATTVILTWQLSRATVCCQQQVIHYLTGALPMPHKAFW
jgi:hypothetical protein